MDDRSTTGEPPPHGDPFPEGKALGDACELYRASFQCSGEAILALAGGRIVECNDRAAEMFGATPRDLRGSSLGGLSPPRQPDGTDSSPRLRELLETALAGRSVVFEWVFRRRTGASFQTEVSVRGAAVTGRALLVVTVRDISARKSLDQRLRDMATHDTLTDLPNRRALLNGLHAVYEAPERCSAGRCMLFRFNVDRFHVLNSAMGYGCGDQVLISFGERLRRIAARLEGGPGPFDMPACLGGDEFALLVTGVRPMTDLVPRLLQWMTEPLAVESRRLHCGVSMGVAACDTASSPHDLLRNAETALARTKQSGGSRVVAFEPRMQEELEARASLEEDLRGAIERDEVFPVFQPIVSLAMGRVVGCEALLRWRHPVRGLIPPSEFIPIAEDSEMIVRLGEFAMARAVRQLRTLDGVMPPDRRLWMSVNLSKRQFQDDKLTERLGAITEAAGIDPGRIKLEVTESLVMEDLERCLSTLEHLRERGFKLAMDDFGTGLSSLSSLRRFPVDTLKIDRSFISGIGPDRQYAAVVNAIISLAHNLGMSVVAEGIEERDQIAQLQAMECDEGQGYVFSKALDGDAVIRTIQSLDGLA